MNNLNLIIGREYAERVRKKSFLITTILMPLLMLALMIIPTLIVAFSDHEESTIVVIDRTGVIGSQLISDDITKYEVTDIALDSALKIADVSAIVEIPASAISVNSTVRVFSNEPSSMKLESDIRHQINSIIENERLKQYNIDNLSKIMEEVKSDIIIQTFRNDPESDSDDNEQSSTMISYMIAMALTFLLYMLILIYGQMVMTSIIEEKTNRVLELVVSSVKPTQLMLGKILGIGLVAVTQIVIWGALIALLSAFVMPMILPHEIAADVAAINAGSFDPSTLNYDIDMLQAIAMLSNISMIFHLFGWLLVFLVGGFLLYAAISAAIGASVDNIQDTSQLQWISTVPIILGIMFAMVACNDPNSSMAIWTSIIPFTSPMVMVARIPFGIPEWQIFLSAIILYITFIATVWCAAKIYRVGIFMYGKKPTVKDLVKWMRYK